MEKASKWIQNFLMGKRDEKDNKKRGSSLLLAAEEIHKKPIILPSSAHNNKEKRRWSFKKSKSSAATDNKFRHKSNRSFDEIYTAHHQLVKQVIQEQDIEQIRIRAGFPSNSISNDTRSDYGDDDLIPTKYYSQVKIRLRKDADAAAIKIQSAFRSYLARRALKALRALVKLQALVRGHLVRKQTNAVLRCMHSLMTIQVRARFNRVQMADQTPPPIKPQKLLQPFVITTNINNINQENRRSTSRYKSGALDDDDHHHHHPQVQHNYGFSKVHSDRLSISKPEYHHQICYPQTDDLRSDSTSTTTTTNHDQQIQTEEILMADKEQYHKHSSFSNNTNCTSKTKPRNFQHSPLSFHPHTSITTMSSFGSPLLAPCYMSDTESSKAKTRSHSEPKRRPKTTTTTTTKKVSSPREKEKGRRRSTSMEGIMSWDEQHNNQQYPWLFKLYRSTKPVKKECNDIDSSTSLSVTTYNNNYVEQPPVNMY